LKVGTAIAVEEEFLVAVGSVLEEVFSLEAEFFEARAEGVAFLVEAGLTEVFFVSGEFFLAAAGLMEVSSTGSEFFFGNAEFFCGAAEFFLSVEEVFLVEAELLVAGASPVEEVFLSGAEFVEGGTEVVVFLVEAADLSLSMLLKVFFVRFLGAVRLGELMLIFRLLFRLPVVAGGEVLICREIALFVAATRAATRADTSSPWFVCTRRSPAAWFALRVTEVGVVAALRALRALGTLGTLGAGMLEIWEIKKTTIT
jgi:hypothetical protein